MISDMLDLRQLALGMFTAGSQTGPVRAWCRECHFRFPWPADVSWMPGEPFNGHRILCPNCWLVVPLAEESYDDRWWTYYIENFGT